MRLFVAINLPPDLRQSLFDSTTPLRSGQFPVRWVMPDAMHITLKFLGETEDERADSVRRIMRETTVRHRPFMLRFGPIGAFPNLRRPRVVWLGVAADPELADLQRETERDLAQLGFDIEARPFRPHVTLGRGRNEARPAAFNGLEPIARSITIGAEPVFVSAIELMRSRLGRGGAVYERIDRFDLGGTGEPKMTTTATGHA